MLRTSFRYKHDFRQLFTRFIFLPCTIRGTKQPSHRMNWLFVDRTACNRMANEWIHSKHLWITNLISWIAHSLFLLFQIQSKWCMGRQKLQHMSHAICDILIRNPDLRLWVTRIKANSSFVSKLPLPKTNATVTISVGTNDMVADTTKKRLYPPLDTSLYIFIVVVIDWLRKLLYVLCLSQL